MSHELASLRPSLHERSALRGLVAPRGGASGKHDPARAVRIVALVRQKKRSGETNGTDANDLAKLGKGRFAVNTGTSKRN